MINQMANLVWKFSLVAMLFALAISVTAVPRTGKKTTRGNKPPVAAQSKAAQAKLDPAKPADVVKIERKLNCSTTDDKMAVYWWQGRVYSRVPGERDRNIFNVHGFNLRACKSFNDPKRGPGYRSVSREMLIYTDPQTGQVLRSWKNPWTNEEVEVLHVANDPVNARGVTYAHDENGKALVLGGFQKEGKLLSGGSAARLFYKNPLGGDYQDNIGGTYHAMEYINAEANLADLLDASKGEATDRVLNWVRVSKWLPWMKMGDRPGMVIFHTAGLRLESFDDMPDVVKNEVKTNWPLFQTAPPTDDQRPNMTSWDQFKRWIDGKKK